MGLLLLASVSRVAIAQTSNTGELTGVVTDPSNAVLADADVQIKDNAKGATQSTRTDQLAIVA
jgi:hypothetical protein